MVRESQYFSSLTGIRAIAAYMVYMHHLAQNQKFLVEYTFFHQLILSFNYGVSIFFVLSGFLISYRYYKNNFRLISVWKNYLINRIARIYPLFFILTLVTFILSGIFHIDQERNSMIAFFYNITFLKSFSIYYIFSGIAQGWSLTVEECFYFSAPLVFLFLSRSRFLIPIGIAFGLGILFVYLQYNFQNLSLIDSLKFTFSYTYFGRITEFVIGAFLGKYFIGKRETLRTPFFNMKTYFGLTGIFFLLCTIAILNLNASLISSRIPISGILITFINIIPLPLTSALFLWGLATESTFVSRLLSNRVFVLLGKSSYAFYLIHFGIIAIVLERYVIGSPFSSFILLNLLSIALFLFLEEPLNRGIRNLLKKSTME